MYVCLQVGSILLVANLNFQSNHGISMNTKENTMTVDIYFNFHKKVFSVRKKGKVIQHATAMTVIEPKFVVQPAGRAKVLRDKVKNVHAFVRVNSMYTVDMELNYEFCEPFLPSERVKYNPYMADTFVSCATGDAIHEAEVAYLTIDNDNKPCINIVRSSNEI